MRDVPSLGGQGGLSWAKGRDKSVPGTEPNWANTLSLGARTRGAKCGSVWRKYVREEIWGRRYHCQTR